MTAIKLDGKQLSQFMKEQLSIETDRILLEYGRSPHLVTLMVGANPASKMYVQMKKKACDEVGIVNDVYTYPELSEKALLQLIKSWNEDDTIDGILIQHPLPNNIDEVKCFNEIRPDKDVDGLSATSYGNLNATLPAFAPATAQAMMTILDYYQIPIEGKNAVVVGRSQIVGKPMATLLLNRNATVTICHSKTNNLKEHLKNADIVVAAVGKPNFIKSEWLKEGSVVLDAGYNKGNIGDVDPKGILEKASYYPPVPGGVGPMTIVSLLAQTIEAAKIHLTKDKEKQLKRR